MELISRFDLTVSGSSIPPKKGLRNKKKFPYCGSNVKDIADIDEEVTTPVQYRKAGKRLAMLYKLWIERPIKIFVNAL